MPITFISIRLLRTIHPVVIGNSSGGDGSFSMTGDMKLVFFFSLFVFTVLFVDFLWHRVRLGNLAAKVEQLRLKVSG